MSDNTYRFWKLLVVIIVAILVGWAVPSGYAFIPVPVAVIGMGILYIIKRGVKEVVIDERTYNIANRASRMAFQIVTLAMVLIGATLVALSYGKYPGVGPVGLTLIYSAAGLVAVYLISYVYYGKKVGGKS
jgi:uncharacterized membrane protein